MTTDNIDMTRQDSMLRNFKPYLIQNVFFNLDSMKKYRLCLVEN